MRDKAWVQEAEERCFMNLSVVSNYNGGMWRTYFERVND